MDRQKINRIDSIETTENGEVRVVVIFDKKEMADQFIPYYNIQDDLRKALLPIILEEVLKDKEAIVKKVLLDVNWTEIVRSEVAQRVIKEIATGQRSY